MSEIISLENHQGTWDSWELKTLKYTTLTSNLGWEWWTDSFLSDVKLQNFWREILGVTEVHYFCILSKELLIQVHKNSKSNNKRYQPEKIARHLFEALWFAKKVIKTQNGIGFCLGCSSSLYILASFGSSLYMLLPCIIVCFSCFLYFLVLL